MKSIAALQAAARRELANRSAVVSLSGGAA